MSNKDKQLPSPEEFITSYLDKSPAYVKYEFVQLSKDAHKALFNSIGEYARDLLKYTLEQAADKTKLTEFASEFMQEGASDAIDKQSILSLEERIIKDLKL